MQSRRICSLAPRYVAGLLIALGMIFLLLPIPKASPRAPVRILDRHGTLLYEVRQPDFGSQEIIALEEIPQPVIDALIATEDRTFYWHPGVSARGVLRAMYRNAVTGHLVAGGSTITQQLVRNILQPEHRGLMYKSWEALLALKLDLVRSKDEILEQYLNTAYFGHQAYGIKAAANTYFGKTPQELSVAEGSLLIGLLQSPVALDPFVNFKGAKERQAIVLQSLVDTGKITQEEMDDAGDEALRLTADRIEIKAPHFVLGLRTKDLGQRNDVMTTLDLPLQMEVERIIAHQLEKLAEKNVTSAAAVVLDVHNGDVLAMVGSADYFDVAHDGAVNVATSARQPGSALKPFTYALALSLGDTAATTVADTEAQFFTQEGNPYVPRNYDFDVHGLVRYREALANSYNIAAVKVLEHVGVDRLLSFLRRAGITTLTDDPEHYGLALTLGSGEVRLLDLAAAYGIFPRGGRTLTRRMLLSDPVPEGTQILDSDVAWLITDILSDNDARLPEFGGESPLVFSRPVASKTGTTRNARDNWVIGYSPDRIVGVWVGNADNSPMKGTSGVTGAGPIYHDVMEAALANFPPRAFDRPDAIRSIEICRLSGKLPTDLCPDRVREWFIPGTEPTEEDDIYQKLSIDTRTGLLASDACPPALVEERVFMVFPRDIQPWARDRKMKVAPVGYSPLCEGSRNKDQGTRIKKLVITRPHDGDSYLLDPLIPDENEKIIFEANARDGVDSIRWIIDGEAVGEGVSPSFRFEWMPTVGVHRIEAQSGSGSALITVDVTIAQ